MFRILALDGGGIKGAFSAAVLQQFETQLGRPILDHFDLTVGTSTGGITALALACGLKASRILQRRRPKNSSSRQHWLDWIDQKHICAQVRQR